MRQLAETISKNLALSEKELREKFCTQALFLRRKTVFLPQRETMLVTADYRQLLPENLEGEEFPLPDGCCAMICPMNSRNIAVMQTLLPFLNPCPPSGTLSFGAFSAGKMPLFQAESQEELEKITVSVFCSGREEGFAVCSTALSGGNILPLLVPEESGAEPDERQKVDYAGHTFVLDNTKLFFSAEELLRCTRRYSGVLRYLSSCRRQTVLALPEEAAPCELLFINRELWLLKAKQPVILLPADAPELFGAVNRTYGNGSTAVRQ
ncbi:MAG: hypothetical protein J6C40_13875 [Lentisphaeria bacterium]|nr:hypothetical protein [Lentisphaeria bacterium]